MNNIYYRDIIELLLQHGKEGLKLSVIVKYIYNQHVDMFDDSIKYDEIYKAVGLFLWKQSQKRESPFRHNSYGVYSIKPDVAVQLDFFWDLPAEEQTTAPEEEPRADRSTVVQMELFKSGQKPN